MDGTIRIRTAAWFATAILLAVACTLLTTQAWSADASPGVPGEHDSTFVPMVSGASAASQERPEARIEAASALPEETQPCAPLEGRGESTQKHGLRAEFDSRLVDSGRRFDAEPSLFVPISSYRTYDSRTEPEERVDSETTPPCQSSGKWRAGDDFVINIHSEESDETWTQLIPDWATAVAFNVTAVATEGSGFIQIYGPGTDAFSTSTVNWTQSGLNIANSGSTKLGSHGESCADFCGNRRQTAGCYLDKQVPWIYTPEDQIGWNTGYMGIAVGGPAGTRTHVVIDITGYYIPPSRIG